MAIGVKLRNYKQHKEEVHARKKQRQKAKSTAWRIKRGLLPKSGKDQLPEKVKRYGTLTEAEKTLVQQFVADQPQELSPQRIQALSIAMDRRPEAIRGAIAEARSKFVENQKRYVNLHMTATEMALETGDYDAAAKHAEWALSHAKDEDGSKIADSGDDDGKNERVGIAPAIMIGVQLGGVKVPGV